MVVVENLVKTRIVYLGLGSNIEQPRLQIKKAIKALENLDNITVISNAGYFESKPMGPEDQPDFVNTVVKLETVLTASELLTQCQLIEQQQGRVKKRHWGERCIDLDILLYGCRQIKTASLCIPHSGLCQRDFVYKPLLKLNAEIEIPGKGLLRNIIKNNDTVTSGYACQFTGCIL